VIYLAIAMVFTAGINEGHWDREKVYIDPANEEHQEHTRRVERARTLDGYLAILWPIFMPFYVLIHRRRIQIREQTADQPDLDDKYLTQAASR
jgi:hypothetical protein